MAKRKEKAVAKAEKKELAVKTERLGLENVNISDLTLARLKLGQALTSEVVSKEAEPGDFINNLTGFNYGKDIAVVPLIFIKSQIFWVDLKEGGGIRCRSFDGIGPVAGGECTGPCGTCENNKWTEKKGMRVPPACTQYLNFPCIVVRYVDTTSSKKKVVDHLKSASTDFISPMNIVVLSFGRTAMPAGKRMVSIAQFSGGDIFSTVYDIKSTGIQKDRYNYHVPLVNPGGKVANEKMLSTFKSLYMFLKPRRIDIHEPDEVDDLRQDI